VLIRRIAYPRSQMGRHRLIDIEVNDTDRGGGKFKRGVITLTRLRTQLSEPGALIGVEPESCLLDPEVEDHVM
jgi:hypothetical protein